MANKDLIKPAVKLGAAVVGAFTAKKLGENAVKDYKRGTSGNKTTQSGNNSPR